MMTGSTRRAVLVTGVTGGAALLAGGCGAGGDGGESPDASRPGPGDSAPSAAARSGEELARTDDIPVGGGRVLSDSKVVVTQPTEGDFRAFSAICTHRGCTVTAVLDSTITCGCHGSRFSIEDGSVTTGPATKPLPEERITVEENSIRLA